MEKLNYYVDKSEVTFLRDYIFVTCNFGVFDDAIEDSVDYDKITPFDKAQVDAYFLLKEERPYAVIYAWADYKTKHIMDTPIIVYSEEELREVQRQLKRKGIYAPGIVFYYSQLRQIERSLNEKGLIEEERL